MEHKWHWDAGDVAQHHNAASSCTAGNHCRSLAWVSNTAGSSKTQRFTQLPSELSILTVLRKEEKDFTGLFDLIKYLENTVADLDVFQTELTMAAYKAVMLQLACISWTYDTLTTQTLRELASTHYTRGIYTMRMLDLHYSSHNFLKLITGLINWKKSWTLWDSSCMIFLKE